MIWFYEILWEALRSLVKTAIMDAYKYKSCTPELINMLSHTQQEAVLKFCIYQGVTQENRLCNLFFEVVEIIYNATKFICVLCSHSRKLYMTLRLNWMLFVERCYLFVCSQLSSSSSYYDCPQIIWKTIIASQVFLLCLHTKLIFHSWHSTVWVFAVVLLSLDVIYSLI